MGNIMRSIVRSTLFQIVAVEAIMMSLTTYLIYSSQEEVFNALLFGISGSCVATLIFNLCGRFTSQECKWFGICCTFASVFTAILISHVTLNWIYEHFMLLAGIATILLHVVHIVLIIT